MSYLKVAPESLAQFREIRVPFEEGVVDTLNAGDLVSLTGVIYTGRDQTHRRLMALLDEGKQLPVDLAGQLLYYVGPTPAPPGKIIGSAGPTTSYRMDSYTPRLLELGLKGTLGKGKRSQEVRDSMLLHRAVYLASIAGAGALLSRSITKADLVAFEDAGPEAMFRFEVERFPAVVINDLTGRDFYDLSSAR
ncbi:MAG: FumA C-terminus/TtdB family hydratase beta subunit [Proteobacteria bacterium]|nr:FumA C-terminus/TtdB family hydratase beta subunit [Pseudomonadota bacterium]MBU1686823.1 FumA C-terminus/TtdB family hydratase beta subunit [Pseudomonadota bacterium]